ncbi:MAG: hypothetical protein U9P38_05145 [Campylobacterota bacterium]|nr:hypothetical protein [Campylobacterota bacterium]
MSHKQILFLILGIDAFVLLFQTTELSISYKELLIISGDISFLQLLIKSSLELFSHNDFSLRLPMIVLHLLSATLLYAVSKNYILRDRDRLWLVVLFTLLPGVMSSAIVINSAGLVIFGLFLFLYFYQNFNHKYLYLLLIAFLFIERDFLYLFSSLIVYSIYKKENKFLILNTILFIASITLYGIDISGTPSGHFLESIGIYATVFTPVIFIYLFYVLYKKYLLKEFDILWFIASTVLIYSLLISFRQKIAIEDFAPYTIVALPLYAQTFIHSYRVRLKVFRKNYRNIFIFTFALLSIHSFIILLNKELYIFIEKPKKHFAYKMHIAKELSNALKSRDINCVSQKSKLLKRLEFYDIKNCKENIVEEIKLSQTTQNSVTVSYAKRLVYSANVTKLNSK